MHFDFACFALCEMAIEEDSDTDMVEYRADLLSFHASVLDAMKEQTYHTELLRSAHKLRYSGPKWPWRAPEFKERDRRIDDALTETPSTPEQNAERRAFVERFFSNAPDFKKRLAMLDAEARQ